MTHKVSRLLALAMAGLMAGSMFLGSGVAQEAPELTDADVQRFVDAWLPRLADQDYMVDYLNSAEQRSEGWDVYPDAEKARLVHNLVDAFEASNATMRAFLHQDGMPAEDLEMRRNLTVGILFMAIFDKPRLLATLAPLKEPAGEEPTPETATTDVGESAFFAGKTFDDLVAHFEDAKVEFTGGSPLPVVEVVDPYALPTLDEVTARAGQDPAEVLGQLAANGIEPLPTVPVELPTIPEAPVGLPSLEPIALPASPVDVPALPSPGPAVQAAADLLDYALGTATYRVCWSLAGGAQRCTTMALPAPAVPAEVEDALAAHGVALPALPGGPAAPDLPAVLAVPTPVDVDGDGVPDITVTLAAVGVVDPESLNPGAQVLFRVERINPLTSALPLEVAAHYQLPGPPEVPAAQRPYAVLGFGSRDLPRVSAVTATISDLLSAEVDVGLALTTGDAKEPLTLLGGTYAVRLAGDRYEAYDPTIAWVTLSPTPASLAVDFDQDHQAVLQAGQSVLAEVLDLAATASAPTRVDVQFLSQRGAGAQVVFATIADLPQQLAARLTSTDAKVSLGYEASATIGLLEARMYDLPDVADVGTFDLQMVRIEGLPKKLSLVTEEQGTTLTVDYDASEVLAKALFVQAAVEAGQALPVEYLQLSASGVPTSIGITKTDRKIALEASAPIGEVSLLRWSGVGTPYALVGDHVLDVTRVVDGQRWEQTSAALRGLQAAEVAIAGGEVQASLAIEGGHAFAARITDEVVEGGRSTSKALTATVSNLPRSIALGIREGHLRYQASDVVRNVAVMLEDEARGPGEQVKRVVASVDEVPKGIDVAYSLTGSSLRYEASSRLAAIRVAIHEHDTLARQSRDVFAQVLDLPRIARISWDAAEQELFYETSERLGRIEALVVEEIAGRTALTYAGATDLPTRVVASLKGDQVIVDADSPVGLVEFASSNYRGWRSLPGDHALVLDDGRQRSTSARISGIQRAAIDLDARSVTLDFQGGQEFLAVVADAGQLGMVRISNVPRQVGITFGEDAITYRASDRIRTVEGFFCQGAVDVARLACPARPATMGLVRLTDVPTDIRIQVQPTGTVQAAVVMDSRLGRMEAFYSETGSLVGLPGSDDFLLAIQGPQKAFGARITGFEGLLVDADGTHLEVDMLAGTPLTVLVLDGRDFVQARLSNLPGRVVVDLVMPGTATYKAENVIQRIDILARQGSRLAVGSIQGVPRLLTLDWASDRVLYHASENVARAFVAMGEGSRWLAVDMVGVPRTMSFELSREAVTFHASSNMAQLGLALFDGPTVYAARVFNLPMLLRTEFGTQGSDKVVTVHSGGSATTVWLAYTNDGVLGNPWFTQAVNPSTAIQVPFADHAYYRNDGATKRMSLMLSGLKGFTLRQGPALTTLDASFVGGQTITFDALASDGGQRFKLRGFMTNFPSTIHAEIGRGFLAQLDRNVDVYLEAELGPAAAMAGIATPPLTHGLSVRASSLSPLAAKATLFLTGLPTYVRIDPTTNGFEFRNFRPAYNFLVVDAQVASLRGYIHLASPPNDVNLRYGQFDKQFSLAYAANRDSGLLYVDVVDQTGAFLGRPIGGRVEVSNIPRSLNFGGNFQGGGVNVDYGASSPISSIFLGVRQPWVGHFQAWALVRDIPTTWSLRVNDNGAGAPFLSYRSGDWWSGSDSLDLYVSIDPSLFPLGPVTRLYGALVDIGRVTDFYNAGGGKYGMSSFPYTRQVYLSADARQGVSYFDNKFSWDSFYWYWYYANINLDIRIDNFVVYSEYLTGLTVKPGLAMRFEGFNANYFFVGMDGLRMSGPMVLIGQLYVLIWPVLNVALTMWFDPSVPVPLRWDVWNDHWYTLLQWSIVFWGICWPQWHWGWSSWVQWHCLQVTVTVSAHPHAHRSYYSWWGGGFALWREESSTQLVFLNPLIPMYVNGWSIGVPWWLEWLYMTFAEGGISFRVSTGWT
jgi:hypothetical protein